jgi:dUTP pyrophosphatase
LSLYGKGIVELLSKDTLEQFNTDVLSLEAGSHKKVLVRCTRCEERFTREFRNLCQLHHCPIRKVREDGVELKWCNKCTSWLCLNQFNKNKARYDGLSSLCITCVLSRPSAIRSNNKKAINRKTSLEAWLNNRLRIKKNDSKRSGIACDISIDYLKKQWLAQDGKCYYLHIPLNIGGKNLRTITLERLDSSVGYIEGNVVFASRFANYAKNAAPIDEFYEVLNGIVQTFTSEIPRIEFLATHKDAKVPSRSRYTDCGYDVSSLINIVINPRDIVNINTGLVMASPVGYYFTVEGRSSMYDSGVVPFRGVIDANYAGNLTISLMNVGTKPYEIKKGDRIAQLIPHKLIHLDISIVNGISSDYNARGTAGHGSSGK